MIAEIQKNQSFVIDGIARNAADKRKVAEDFRKEIEQETLFLQKRIYDMNDKIVSMCQPDSGVLLQDECLYTSCLKIAGNRLLDLIDADIKQWGLNVDKIKRNKDQIVTKFKETLIR